MDDVMEPLPEEWLMVPELQNGWLSLKWYVLMGDPQQRMQLGFQTLDFNGVEQRMAEI